MSMLNFFAPKYTQEFCDTDKPFKIVRAKSIGVTKNDFFAMPYFTKEVKKTLLEFNQNDVFGPVRNIYDELTGDERPDFHYTPVELKINLNKNQKTTLYIVVSVEDKVNVDVEKIFPCTFSICCRISGR